MSSVKALIEFLQTLPPEAEVSVMCHKRGKFAYSPDYMTIEPLCLKPEFDFEGLNGKSSKHIDISDCRANPLMAEEDCKVFVQFGGED